jgi:AAHS family 4-hydroxybenzoate transporter-like MFS transporter
MNRDQVDLADILDKQGWTPAKLLVVLLAAFAVVLDGFDVQILSFAAPDLVADWGIGKSALGPIFAVSFVGMAIGTFGGGWLGDRLGRRGAVLISIVLFAVGTGLIAIAPNLLLLGILRFVSSVGLGAMFPNATSLIAEFTPLRHRAFAVALGLVCNPVGGAIGGVVSAHLLPVLGWRGLFALAGLLPLLLAIILFLILPESLRYLRGTGRDPRQLRAVLGKLGIAAGPETAIVDSAETAHVAKASVRALFAPGLRRDTIGLGIGFFGTLMGVYGLFAWLPLLLAGGGFDLSRSSLGLTLFNASGVLSTIAAGWLIGRFGSKATAGGFALTGVAVAFYFATIPLTVASGATVWTAMVLLGVFVIAPPACLYAMAAYAFPVQVRATGVGFTAGMGRIGATLSALTGAPLVELGSGPFLLMIAAVSAIALAGILVVRRQIPAHVGRGARPVPAA